MWGGAPALALETTEPDRNDRSGWRTSSSSDSAGAPCCDDDEPDDDDEPAAEVEKEGRATGAGAGAGFGAGAGVGACGAGVGAAVLPAGNRVPYWALYCFMLASSLASSGLAGAALPRAAVGGAVVDDDDDEGEADAEKGGKPPAGTAAGVGAADWAAMMGEPTMAISGTSGDEWACDDGPGENSSWPCGKMGWWEKERGSKVRDKRVRSSLTEAAPARLRLGGGRRTWLRMPSHETSLKSRFPGAPCDDPDDSGELW